MTTPETPAAAAPGLAPRGKVKHPMVVRHLEVTAVRRVTPALVRVTLGGPEAAGLVADGPTDHVKVLFPDPVTGVLAVPTVGPGSTLVPPSSGTVHLRDYTVRALRTSGAAGAELDLDIVLHGDAGPASIWAGRAAVGQRLAVAGPKSSTLLPEGVTRVLLVCDETGLAGMARWIELLPPRVSVDVVAEVTGPADEVYLEDVPRRPALDVTWVHRDGPAGSAPHLLEEAVRRRPAPTPGTYVWCAGEAGALVGVRRYLRRELGLPATRCQITGYWRCGDAHFDHKAPLDPHDPD